MPADHVIGPDEVFQAALKHAVDLVEQDPKRIVTFGIKPSYPAEAFGYIERGTDATEAGPFPTFPVKRFREKPDAETAKQFLEAGSFYWNSGIFVWKAQTILDALAEYQPEMFQHIKKIGDAVGTADFETVLQTEFCAINGTSIDYAVMERYPHVQVVEAPFTWDDLGNWSSVPRLRGVDEHGNTIAAKHLGVDTGNTVIRGTDDHLIVTIGIQDCIVVQTKDATLIARKDQENEIKQIVAELEQRQWKEHL
jgi:mannose-1-phosphate guanylyltransferase